MGWATWCTDDYCGLLDYCFEEEIHEIADALVSSGMRDAGYSLVLLDDCEYSLVLRDCEMNSGLWASETSFN
jgi:hypothetical protein